MSHTKFEAFQNSTPLQYLIMARSWTRTHLKWLKDFLHQDEIQDLIQKGLLDGDYMLTDEGNDFMQRTGTHCGRILDAQLNPHYCNWDRLGRTDSWYHVVGPLLLKYVENLKVPQIYTEVGVFPHENLDAAKLDLFLVEHYPIYPFFEEIHRIHKQERAFRHIYFNAGNSHVAR